MRAVGGGVTRAWRVIYLGTLLLLYIALSSCDSTVSAGSPQATITPQTDSVKVKILNSKIRAAIIHVVGTNQTDSMDQNILAVSYCADNQYISVWAPGYYLGEIDCTGDPKTEYSIKLTALEDNLNYNWIAADSRSGSANNCANCHATIQGQTEYLEWNKDGHSKVFLNPYFGNIYMGKNIYGNASEVTVWSILGNGQRIRLSPNLLLPYYGPGYRLDYPENYGNCAYCHAPAAVNSSKQEVDLAGWSNISGSHINVVTEGVTCDICHKVTDIILGDDKLPYTDRPGVLSMSFVRPNFTELFVVGPRPYPLTKDASAKQTCSPVFSESEFCAACHYGKFSDVEIYGSYREWLDSPYSLKYLDSGNGEKTKENKDYRSCQDCHMLSPGQIGDTLPSQRSACSETNLNFRDFNHNMMKYGPDPKNPSQEIPLLIKDAAKLTVVEPSIEGEQIIVRVTVENVGAGHKFPTDSPLRHLILVVEAKDENGTLLTQVDGPRIPSWGGGGNQAEDYAGHPGEVYANILKDKDTNIAPTVAYWNPTDPLSQGSDTRLIPKQPKYSEYSFAAPAYGFTAITVKLMYRYAFIELARQKGWNRPDILVTSEDWECNRLTDPVVFDCEPKVE